MADKVEVQAWRYSTTPLIQVKIKLTRPPRWEVQQAVAGSDYSPRSDTAEFVIWLADPEEEQSVDPENPEYVSDDVKALAWSELKDLLAAALRAWEARAPQ